ncbi:CDK5 regulatory subunit-associated protein 2 isoform X1 [Mobula birostris]|uniref:CDK5 regulatory subunit-associated protein 2 isoform X1 n=1 Tax=Mobula birostris TaxID=1983395 RepID=UPI003B281646
MRMKGLCRVCCSKLQGNQRRWIFNTCTKRRLQIVLSYVLGYNIRRDGQGEFVCSKCAFMLERVIKYDIVIARVKTVSSERLQMLAAEKDQLIQCIVHLYFRHNEIFKSSCHTDAGLSLESSNQPSVQYGLLLEDESILSEFWIPKKSSKKILGCSNCWRSFTEGHKKRWCLCSESVRIANVFCDLVCSTPIRAMQGDLRGDEGSQSHSQSLCCDLVPRSPASVGKLSGRLCTSNLETESTPVLNPIKLDWNIRESENFQLNSKLTENSPSVSQSIGNAIWKIKHVQYKPVTFYPKSRIPRLVPLSTWTPTQGYNIAADVQGGCNPDSTTSEQELWSELEHDSPFKSENLAEKQRQLGQLEVEAKQLKADLEMAETANSTLQEKLKEADAANEALQGQANDKMNELAAEKQNSLKRDKTIQGLTLALKTKDNEIKELYHEIEERDNALVKARDSLHKAQLQKFQGAEEYQSLLTEKESELAEIRADRNGKAMEVQKLQKALSRREQELKDLTEIKVKLEEEVEDLQLQKTKSDKTINDIQNHVQKLGAELAEKECALEHQYESQLTENKQKLQSQELVIERLTDSLNNKDRLLQEYMELLKGVPQAADQSPSGKDALLAKLRDRLREKDIALEQTLDQKYAALDEKENEIRQLHLALREKEHNFDQLKSLLANREETINSLDGTIKEKDVELQRLTNMCKSLQKLKQELEDSQMQSLREKDAVILQLQQSLKEKTDSLEEMRNTLLSQSHCGTKDLAEHLNQRLKVQEKMLENAWAERKKLSSEHAKEIEELLNTINSKDQLIREASEHSNSCLSKLGHGIEGLNQQNAEKPVSGLMGHDPMLNQDQILQIAQLKAALDEKDKIIDKLVEHGQKDQHSPEHEALNSSHVLELKQTIQILQEQLHERDGEFTQDSAEEEVYGKVPYSKKTSANLKKELAQKSRELDEALKRENEAKMEVIRLQALLDQLEKDAQVQAANVEELSKALQINNEAIKNTQPGFSSEVKETEQVIREVIVLKDDVQRPGHLPRERTIIGGDGQQPAQAIEDQVSEESLHQALKTEQQLYSRLIKAVKDSDSCSRIQALQVELTGIQLLRQQLEESIQTNRDLQKNLEQQIQGTKGKEAVSKGDVVDLSEVDSLRHQLEEAQRWNVSLQSRLGQMQARAGGVGVANDSGNTFTSCGDQTSYLSICLGQFDDLEQEVVNLSLPELRQKIIELLKSLKTLQANNQELQDRVSMSEHSVLGSSNEENPQELVMVAQLLHQRPEESMKTNTDLQEPLQSINQLEDRSLGISKDDKCIQTVEVELAETIPSQLPTTAAEENWKLDPALVSTVSAADSSDCTKLFDELNKINSELEDKCGQLQEVKTQLEMTECQLHELEAQNRETKEEVGTIRWLLEENGVSSVTELGNEITKLREEITQLHNQLGESLSVSENEGEEEVDEESKGGLRKSVLRLKIKLKKQRKVHDLLKQQIELNSSGEGVRFNPDSIVSMAKEMEYLKEHLEAANQRRTKEMQTEVGKDHQESKLTQSHPLNIKNYKAKNTKQISTRSRLPVPLKQSRSINSVNTATSGQDFPSDHQQVDQLRAAVKDEQVQSKLSVDETTLVSQTEKLRPYCTPILAESSLKQDDKEVQVDLQDLGYETCGKSDADRDESSSPDTGRHLPAHCYSDSVVPTLHKLSRRFFSMENLDTNSSTSYPSSPSLISPKISLKNLDVFYDYGQTDDANELKLQIGELKAQIEKYRKVLHHLQTRVRKNSLSSDQLTISDQSHQTPTRNSYDRHSLESFPKDNDNNYSHRRHSIQSSDLAVQTSQQIGGLSNCASRSQSVDFGSQHEKGDWLMSVYCQDGQLVQKLKEQIEQLENQLQKENARNEELHDQLQSKLPPALPAQKYDSLVQLQARELSHLRQQIKENRNIFSLHHQSLVDLTKAFEQLLQASDVDYYVGEAFRDQLNQSLQLVEKLESKLDGGITGDASSAYGDNTFVDFSQSARSLQCEILYLRKQLESERKHLHKRLNEVLHENQALSRATKEQLAQLAKEVQEKNETIYYLQQQLHTTPANLVASDSEISDRNSISSHEGRSTTPEPPAAKNSSKNRSSRERSFQQKLNHNPSGGFSATNSDASLQSDPCDKERVRNGLSVSSCVTAQPPADNVDGTLVSQVSPTSDWLVGYADAQALYELERENCTLREQLMNKEELNETLRTELDLHRSILTHKEQNADSHAAFSLDHSGHTLTADKQTEPKHDSGLPTVGDLAAHLHEIRSLRQRLEESIRNNDKLRQQLVCQLSAAENDPASTNIFIHGADEHTHMMDEVRYLKEQNKALKVQLTKSSRDKQRENEKLKESLSKKVASIERLRNECERVKRESTQLQLKVNNSHEENRQLKDELHYSREEISRLQRELNLQHQLFTENQELLHSLQVELRVYEQLKGTKAEPVHPPSPGSVNHFQGSAADLSDLTAEIRCLRIQLERSIQTNTALRQKLEEQLRKGQLRNEGSPSTININYLLSRGHRSAGVRRLYQDSEADSSAEESKENFQSHGFATLPRSANVGAATEGSSFAIPGIKVLPKDDSDSCSHYTESLVGSSSQKPVRRIWADRDGLCVLGLLEDYTALRKHLSEGRSLLHGMDTRLGAAACQSTAAMDPVEPLLKDLSSNVTSMQQVLKEAGRLLKLFWRVSLPTPTAHSASQHQQEKVVKDEVSRLRKKLTEQEKLLHGTVKRLRTTNQLKEGMEKIIIDQLSLTHDVLKKARGNLEMNHYMVFDLKGFPKQSEADRTLRGCAAKWELIKSFNRAINQSGCSEEAHSASEEIYDSLTSSFCSY